MKTEIKRQEFVPFTLIIKIETHEEFKELYSAVYDKNNLDDIVSELLKYSNDNKISV